MNRDSTASISIAPIGGDEIDTLGPTSERWNDVATIYELDDVPTMDCCGMPDDLCGCDPREVAAFTAEASRLFTRPIMCRPASQWGAR